MIKNLKIASALKLLPFFMVTASLHAGVIVGNTDQGNCFPYACGPSVGLTRYQQVYSASAFDGTPLLINSITMFGAGEGLMDSADYLLSFSTTSASVTTLSSDLDANVGLDTEFFANVSVGGLIPLFLTITGTPFLYNPSDGNLLLDIVISNTAALSEFSGFFEADSTQTETARAYALGFGNSGAQGWALVTEFNADLAGVPEPGTYGMFAIGAVALLSFRKRK